MAATTFEPTVAVSTGAYAGDYLWSDPANWTNGLPVDGETVIANGIGYDDINGLSLASLSIGGAVYVTAGTLSVGLVSGVAGYDLVADAGADPATTVSIMVGTVAAGDPPSLAALGRGSTITDLSATDPGVDYDVAGTLILAAPPSARSSFTLESNSARLVLANPGSVIASAIEGIQDGDVIEVPGTSAGAVTFGEDRMTVVTNEGTYSFTDIAGIDAPPTDTTAVDAAAGMVAVTLTNILDYGDAPPCYAQGTGIATPYGEVPIETLAVGDLVLTASGEPVPISWIGRRRIDLRRRKNPERVTPIRIAPDTFGPGRPWRALLLSPDHAIYVDGVLIPIRHLCDGRGIAPVARATITYFHIELPRHDVLLANGLPAESYLDAGVRAAFDNGGQVVQAHPDFAARAWEAEGYARLVVAGPVLEAVRARLPARGDDKATAA